MGEAPRALRSAAARSPSGASHRTRGGGIRCAGARRPRMGARRCAARWGLGGGRDLPSGRPSSRRGDGDAQPGPRQYPSKDRRRGACRLLRGSGRGRDGGHPRPPRRIAHGGRLRRLPGRFRRAPRRAEPRAADLAAPTEHARAHRAPDPAPHGAVAARARGLSVVRARVTADRGPARIRHGRVARPLPRGTRRRYAGLLRLLA